MEEEEEEEEGFLFLAIRDLIEKEKR